MTQANLLPTQKKIEAFTAAMLWVLSWLVGVMTKLGAPRRSRMLTRFVRYCEDRVECILFLQAARRCGLNPRRRALRGARSGFRYTRPCARLLLRGAGVRASGGASFEDRIARLFEVLADPEPFIAHFAARIRKGLRDSGVVLASSPRDPLDAAALRAACGADSS